MNPSEAQSLLGLLIGGTPGWTNAPDETLIIYTTKLQGLNDTQTAHTAIMHLIDTWDQPRRPPVATLLATYQTIVRRNAMARPTLGAAPHTVLELDEGRRVAARAYAQECAARPHDDIHVMSGWRTTEPSPKTLDALLGIIGVTP